MEPPLCSTVGRRPPGSLTSFRVLQTYTLGSSLRTVKTMYHILLIINCPDFMIVAPLLSYFNIGFVIKGFEIKAFLLRLNLWSSLYSVLVETVLLRWVLSFVVTIDAAHYMCCLDAVLFNVRRSLSINFNLRPLFLFLDGI